MFARFHFLNSSGKKTSLDLIGLHLVAGEFEAKRNAQAEFIASFAKENLPEESHLLIMGDMNDYNARVKGHKL